MPRVYTQFGVLSFSFFHWNLCLDPSLPNFLGKGLLSLEKTVEGYYTQRLNMIENSTICSLRYFLIIQARLWKIMALNFPWKSYLRWNVEVWTMASSLLKLRSKYQLLRSSLLPKREVLDSSLNNRVWKELRSITYRGLPNHVLKTSARMFS